MKSNIKWEGNLRFSADNGRGHTSIHDATIDADGNKSGPTPMELMLQSVATCSGMDVVSIIKKKRKTILDFEIEISGERQEEHPQIFTSANLHYTLTSPDAKEKDLKRAVELSQEKYCAASGMFQLSGVMPTWTLELIKN
jgi:putative redox protein